MAICEYCGEHFNRDDATEIFEVATCLSYDNLRKTLCGECAVKAIEDLEDGVYFETCEECGCTFDLIEDQARFDSNFGESNGTSLTDYWEPKILCCDCAIEKAEESMDDEDFEDDEETMNVYDAALIWASHGKDEDYTFGYSEDELEEAL